MAGVLKVNTLAFMKNIDMVRLPATINLNTITTKKVQKTLDYFLAPLLIWQHFFNSTFDYAISLSAYKA